EKTFGTLEIQRGENLLDFSKPFPRTSYQELFKQYVGIDILTISDEELVEAVKKHRVDTDISLGRGRLLDQLYKKAIRPFLIQPQFIIDHPLELSPLAKKHADNQKITQRFQILIDGA